MSNTESANWYANVFKNWQVKVCGPKPTAEMLAQVHGLGLRPGKQALATAMGLRDGGVTRPQIILACGNPQFNRMGGLVTDALLKRVAVSPGNEGHTVYKFVLTPKGNKRIEAQAKRDATLEAAGKADDGEKPVKAKKAVKAAGKVKGKVKAKKAVTVPEAETPTGDVPSPVEQAPNPTDGQPLENGNQR